MNLLCKKRKEKKENHLQPQKQGKSGYVEVSLGPEQSHHGQVCGVGVVFKIHFICGGSILVNFSNGIYNSSEKFRREHILSKHVATSKSWILMSVILLLTSCTFIWYLFTSLYKITGYFFGAKFCCIISNTKKFNFKYCVHFFFIIIICIDFDITYKISVSKVSAH